MERVILALNCGSSSLKFGLYRSRMGGPLLVREGEAEEIGRKNSSIPDHAAALARALESMSEAANITAVGHRIVHGGADVRTHQVLTPDVMERLQAAVPFAPLHVPAALSVIEATERKLPKARQVVCLDTAFHREMPPVSRTLPLSSAVRGLGVERFGFHGLSLESIVAQMDAVPDRLVVAHLGNGSSITAIRKGQSIDTSMGLTPAGGIMMGTRCGDLDPGTIVYLMRKGYEIAEKLEALIDRESGLLGISETSSDVRELLRARSEDARADLALEMFCYQARKTIASMAATLGGLDALIFTGGIGEHAAPLRDEICAGLKFLGDFQVRILPAQEDLQIARITGKFAAT
jgi:acetate kinase